MSGYVYDFDEGAYENDDDDGYHGPDAHVGNGNHDDDYEDYEGEGEGEEGEEDDDDRDMQLDAEDELDRLQDGDEEREALQEELEQLVSDQLQNDNTPNDAIQSSGNVTTIDLGALFQGGSTVDVRRFLSVLSRLGVSTSNDDEETPRTRRSRRRPVLSTSLPPAPSWWKAPHREPQPSGVQLIMSGEFGRVGVKRRLYYREGWTIDKQGKVKGRNVGEGQEGKEIHPGFKLDYALRSRHTMTRYMPKEDLMEELVPNTNGTVVASYPSNVYCGQYSADSSFYYVCRKDYHLHIYDMNAPRHPTPIKTAATGHQTTLKELKSIRGYEGGWTITDSHLSPSNDRMIYSSMGSQVYMVKTLEPDESQVAINFQDPQIRRRGLVNYYDDDYVIWSCRFSADGNEVIAGGQRAIYVYDLLANRRTVKIIAHDEDVNSCCWADSGSNVLVSASDDSFLKVWDRRSLGSSRKPSGVLIGHTEGIAYVSAKGDGRYLISNGKDQALRLWDLRKMRSNQDYEGVKRQSYGIDSFDYRYAQSKTQTIPAHPKDCSVMAYRGHTVMRTLIRCHFSPAETTGSSYIYSGSADGRIYIWSVDGRLVQVLDRLRSYPISFDPSAKESGERLVRGSRDWDSAVRDVSWHSQRPVLMSAAWGSRSTVAQHEWKGLDRMGGRLEDWVAKAIAEGKEEDLQSRMNALNRPY